MKKVLITGGSEGIGFAIAERYAKEKYDIILVARNQNKLEQARALLLKYGVAVFIYQMDLSLDGSGELLFVQLQKDHHEVDILVNNAGVGYAGYSYEIPIRKDEDLIRLNCISLMTLTKQLIIEMKRKNSGMIINVASTGAFQAGPLIASYYASKAFVLSYTKAIAYELKDTDVIVHALCPGPTDTAFYEKSRGIKPPYMMSKESVAAYLFRHQFSKRVVLIPGWMNRVLLWIPESMRIAFIALLKIRMRKQKYER